MRCTLMFFLILGIAPAQEPADNRAMLAEIRGLRSDLQNTAAAAQRAQIVMFRLLFQAYYVEKASHQLEMAHSQCEMWRQSPKTIAAQIEQMKKQVAQNPADQKAMEERIAELQASSQEAATQAQQCQATESEADALYRNEQARKIELEAVLERLDQILAAAGAK